VSTSFLYFPVSITDMSTENCIIFNTTTVQKEIFVGIGSIQKNTFRQFFFFQSEFGTNRKERGKNKKPSRRAKWCSERSGLGDANPKTYKNFLSLSRNDIKLDMLI
jgi:hypothetical protein